MIARRGGRTGHAHDQAEIGYQPVIGPEDGGAERIAAQAVAALQPRQGAAGDSPRQGFHHGLDDAVVRALGRGQAAGDRFRLIVILPAVALLEAADGRQDELGPEAMGEPGKDPGPPTRLQPADVDADPPELLAPEFGMGLLDGSQTVVDLAEMRIALRRREGAVERGAIDLALKIGPIAAGGLLIGIGHDEILP